LAAVPAPPLKFAVLLGNFRVLVVACDGLVHAFAIKARQSADHAAPGLAFLALANEWQQIGIQDALARCSDLGAQCGQVV
jgi:hypothetical protein